MELTRMQIKEIQSMLNRAGYGVLVVDGIYGYRTRNAIINFQRNNGLVPDGIIGPLTYKVINDYLNGYFNYKIVSGDTYYKLGEKYGVDYRLIEAANPGIDPYNLMIGTNIIIPYPNGFVATDMEYTYMMLLRNIRSIKTLYPFVTLGKAGSSSLGKGLYYIKFGTGINEAFLNGSHHGLEWITTPLLMKYIQDFLKSYVLGEEFAGENAKDLYVKMKATFLPMVNPDGVDLVLEGLKRDNPNYDELIVWNNGSMDFSKTWQANNNGVDINHNYDAGWQEYRELARQEGYDMPGPTRYPGTAPNSETETRAVVSLVNQNNYRLAIAYHTQGEVIYWKYQDIDVLNSRAIGEMLANASGYSLASPDGLSSYSGFKDWFILSKRLPGYTVEAGRGQNPLPVSQFPQIYRDNVKLITRALKITADM